MASPTWDRIEGNWKQFTGMIQERWGQLTNDDLEEIKGRREKLEGQIQKRYGIAQQEASGQIDEWLKKLNL